MTPVCGGGARDVVLSKSILLRNSNLHYIVIVLDTPRLHKHQIVYIFMFNHHYSVIVESQHIATTLITWSQRINV